MMSSSSESDEEEAQRIREAVSCNESRADLFATKKNKNWPSNPKNTSADIMQACPSAKPKEHHLLSETDISANGRNCGKFRPYHHETVNVSGVPLKSNRPQVNNDDNDVNNRLAVKTTPEFRAFVAKHLEKQLDKELETCLTSSVWSCLAHNGESDKLKEVQKRVGVKLLSDSKTLLGDNSGTDTSQTKAEKTAPVKKPRLSTSSESSEDERIQACVFTVNDIEAENKTLASLARKKNPETQESQNIFHVCPSSEKDKVVENLNDNDSIDSLKKAKKKKKKKKKKKSEIKDVS